MNLFQPPRNWILATISPQTGCTILCSEWPCGNFAVFLDSVLGELRGLSISMPIYADLAYSPAITHGNETSLNLYGFSQLNTSIHGGFHSHGAPKKDCLFHGKSQDKLGWELGVALFFRKPPSIRDFPWFPLHLWWQEANGWTIHREPRLSAIGLLSFLSGKTLRKTMRVPNGAMVIHWRDDTSRFKWWLMAVP